MALGLDSMAYLVGTLDPAYTPTQQLAGSSGGLVSLTSLSQNSKAQPRATRVRRECGQLYQYIQWRDCGRRDCELVWSGTWAGRRYPATGERADRVPKEMTNVQVEEC